MIEFLLAIFVFIGFLIGGGFLYGIFQKNKRSNNDNSNNSLHDDSSMSTRRITTESINRFFDSIRKILQWFRNKGIDKQNIPGGEQNISRITPETTTGIVSDFRQRIAEKGIRENELADNRNSGTRSNINFNVNINNSGGKQMNDAAKKLLNVLEKAVTLPQYKKGYGKWPNGKDKTFCNIFAKDVLDSQFKNAWMGSLISEYNYDVKPILKEGKLENFLGTDCHIGYALANLAKMENKITSLTAKEAQDCANEGIPIWIVSSKYNHEAIVCPDNNVYDEKKGPLIGQAGEYNGIMYMSDNRTWGVHWNDPEIKFYELSLLP